MQIHLYTYFSKDGLFMTTFSDSLGIARRWLHSIWFKLLVFAGAAWVIIDQAPIQGTIGFVLLICALLVLTDNTAVTLLPFSLLCMFVLKEYNSFDRFIKLWWLIIPVVPSLLFHFIVYWEKPKKSILLFGLFATTAAITLGGLGSISSEEYFTGANLYYVAGLGIGMVVMHLLVSAKYHDRDGFDVQNDVCQVFYLVGLFAVFMLLQHFIVNWEDIQSTQKLPNIQWSNNLSTFLMIALPFGFYFTAKHPLHILSTWLTLAAMLLSGSRAPLIFGVLEYVVCSIVFCVIDRKHWYVYVVPLLVMGFTVFKFFDPLMAYARDFLELENITEESRFKMALRAFDEIKSNPLFGTGLGNTSRQDLYNPVKFAMNWYHSAPFQIIGSLGIVGILSYGFLWFTRAKVFFTRSGVFCHTVMLSQFGLFTMSLVNPGFFCPLPYEFFMVMLFSILAQQKTRKETV